jgi:MFS family permease
MPAVTLARRSGAALVGSLVLVSVGGGLFLPLSIIYFTALTAVPLSVLGVLLGAASAIAIPVPLCAGLLVDRLGARSLVMGGQLLQAVSFLAYAWVREPVGIFSASAAGAVGVRLFWSSVFTLIADHADHAAAGGKDLWYARANIARTVGIGLGGLIAGVAIAGGSDAAYRAIAWAASGCFALAAATIATFLRAPSPRGSGPAPRFGYRVVLGDRPFLGLTVLNSCYALSTIMLGLTLPTFIRTALHSPAWLASVILAGNAVLIALLGSPLTRRLSRQRRTRVLCLAAGLWTAWSLSLAAIAPGRAPWAVPVLIAATLAFTLAEVTHAPAAMAIAAACGPPQARGRYLAVFQYSFVAAETVGPVFFTTLFGIGHAVPFLALGAVNAVAIMLTLGLERHLPPEAVDARVPAVPQQQTSSSRG